MKGDKIDLKIIDVKYSREHTKYIRESVGPDLLFPLIFCSHRCGDSPSRADYTSILYI